MIQLAHAPNLAGDASPEAIRMLPSPRDLPEIIEFQKEEKIMETPAVCSTSQLRPTPNSCGEASREAEEILVSQPQFVDSEIIDELSHESSLYFRVYSAAVNSYPTTLRD